MARSISTRSCSVWPACHDAKSPSRGEKVYTGVGPVEEPGNPLREAEAMHKVEIPTWAVERALARRGRLHPFDDVEPARTALVVVDLQNGFMAPGQPAEVAHARDIGPNVNRLA